MLVVIMGDDSRCNNTKLQPFVTFIPVCPEVEVDWGLLNVEENGENRLVQPLTREDVTEKWSSFQMTFTNDTGCGWFYFKESFTKLWYA